DLMADQVPPVSNTAVPLERSCGYAASKPITHDVLRGHQLSPAGPDFVQGRFGHDFSQVPVHADEQAAKSAEGVNALAGTVGEDIVFGRGPYAHETSAGKRLLAQELVHTVQQPNPHTGSGDQAPRLRRTIGDGHDLQAKRFAGDPVLEA